MSTDRNSWHRIVENGVMSMLGRIWMRLFSPGSDVGIRYLGDMKRLTLKPNDIIVITTDHQYPKEIAETIRTALEGKFRGHTVVVLLGGMKIGIMGSGDADGG